MMMDGASGEEELSKKKAVEDFREQLESFDLETLARLNEVEDDSKLLVKNLVSQGAMHKASASK